MLRAYMILAILVLLATIPSSPLLEPAAGLSMTPRPPEFFDSGGHLIQTATVGQPIMISMNFTNIRYEKIGITFLFEVRNDIGITQYLAWQSTTSLPQSTKSAGISWISDSAGDYQIRIFVVSNLTNPQVLSPVETANFVVIKPEEEKKTVSVELDGTNYDIQYNLGYGYIKEVIVQQDIATLSFNLEGVHRNTLLTLRAPEELLFEAFSCGIEPPSRNPNYAVEGFIDTIPINGFFELGARQWEVPIQAGSIEIEFAGTCLA